MTRPWNQNEKDAYAVNKTPGELARLLPTSAASTSALVALLVSQGDPMAAMTDVSGNQVHVLRTAMAAEEDANPTITYAGVARVMLAVLRDEVGRLEKFVADKPAPMAKSSGVATEAQVLAALIDAIASLGWAVALIETGGQVGAAADIHKGRLENLDDSEGNPRTIARRELKALLDRLG